MVDRLQESWEQERDIKECEKIRHLLRTMQHAEAPPPTSAEKRPDSARGEHVPIARRSLDAQQQEDDFNENFSATAFSQAQPSEFESTSAEVLQPPPEYSSSTTALWSSYREAATRRAVNATAPTPSDPTCRRTHGREQDKQEQEREQTLADPTLVDMGGELVEAGMKEVETLPAEENAGDKQGQDTPVVSPETEMWLLEMAHRMHSIPQEQEREIVEEQLVMEAEWRRGDAAEQAKVAGVQAKVASEAEWRRSQEHAEAEWRRR
jgi:hypothetical protein